MADLRSTFAGIELSYMALDASGNLKPSGETTTIACDQVFKAIGQTLATDGEGVVITGGKIEVDAEGRTSLPGVWAGGDCTFGGQDLTVEAVEHGKIAAHSIDRALATSPRAASFNRVRRTAA